MKNSFCFFVLFCCSVTMRAEYALDSLTKEQTIHIIDSLTHSNYRFVKNEFCYEDDKALLTTEIYISDYRHKNDSRVTYKKYFHPNGKVRMEGLEWITRIGTWFYSDTTGHVFKEYNFATGERILYGVQMESLDWVFDSIMHSTERFLIRHYGEAFYKKRIKIDPNISWSTKRYSPYGNYLPEMPDERADRYTVYSEAVFNDSVTGLNVGLEFDSALRIKGFSGIIDTATYYPVINMGYVTALKIAREHGYRDVALSEWYDDEKTFYWCSYIITDVEGDGSMHERTHGKCIKINARTGKYSIEDYNGGFDADGFISDFRNDWTDTVKTKEGWKQMQLYGATFDVPENWIMIENYHHKTYDNTRIVTNGKDTLNMEQLCGMYAEGIGFDPPPHDEIAEKAFLAYFKEGMVQGRQMDLDIIAVTNTTFNIKYEITESGVAFNCGPITYRFEARHVTAEQEDVLLQILKTVRFSTTK